MDQVTTIVVPGVPIAQPRVKAGKGHGGFTKVYTPTKTPSGKSNGIAEYKAGIRIAWQAATKSPPATGPVEIDVVCVFQRPKAMQWKRRPMPRAAHVTKPDSDNILKAVQDALNKLAFVDDSQVCRVMIEKLIAAGDEQAHTVITVRASSAA